MMSVPPDTENREKRRLVPRYTLAPFFLTNIHLRNLSIRGASRPLPTLPFRHVTPPLWPDDTSTTWTHGSLCAFSTKTADMLVSEFFAVLALTGTVYTTKGKLPRVIVHRHYGKRPIFQSHRRCIRSTSLDRRSPGQMFAQPAFLPKVIRRSLSLGYATARTLHRRRMFTFNLTRTSPC